MSVKIVHAADFHLDSAFGALSAELSRQRRRESRELLYRLADLVNASGAELVLLAGDLFDGETVYRETLEALSDALGAMRARVFIAPGNHDPYSARSPYALSIWPENVHIFTSNTVERVELPELGCAVYGAAFTSGVQDESLLADFRAPDDGLVHLMVLHGELSAAESRYDPITKAQIAGSGMDYLALGHTHQFGGVLREGKTAYAYAGCPEQSLSIMRFLLSVQLVLRDIVVEGEHLFKELLAVGAQLFAVRVVGGDHLPRLVRQRCAAAVLPPGRGGEQLEPQPLLGTADDRPRLGIGHGHRHRRRAQRVQLVHLFEQLGHAGAKTFLVRKYPAGDDHAEFSIHSAALPFLF